MNIPPVAPGITKSAEEMGKLLKNVTDSSMAIQEKLIKTEAAEKLSDDKLGQSVDQMA